MLDILKITIIFIAILIFLRLKWNIGYVLLLASGLLAILYLMPIPTILSTIKSTVADPVTIKLFFALTLIKSLEMILREKQVLSKMMEASRNILKRKKAVIISMPMLIGLLPSLGGAYFSAPMVEESTKGLKMSQEEKGFINYWFRHPWEYILPLYPGILLASAITGIELRSLILVNLTYALLIFITGFLFSMRGVKGGFAKKVERRKRDLWSFLPVLLILLMVMAMHIELHYALGFTILLLFVFYRFSPKEAFRVIRHGFTPDVIVIVFGTMLFKFTMENSGAVAHLSQYFKDVGIPILPILFILPFLSGLLTGITVGFVSSTFPLLMSLAGGAHLNEITFAFASGFTGVLLSPVHLCFVLTREYFKADIAGIYRKTIPGCAIIMTGALIVYFIL
ncbi:hypothetical protein JZK55_00770 [Dissulfurispira thermophila]|uniref:DUF401 family protein n=2 Tax=root TaxID=1 RepID=A0A7G1GXT5_9BACT|nr:DUF401 family protein [Dissulfurispira thermophila]BCB95155.1 hypothetical protein JZK55_00770 [Dissulfurispira thermophila]